MQNKDILVDIKPIISDPGWKVIVDRFEYIRIRTEAEFMAVETHEQFLAKKGEYRMIEKVCKLLKNPLSLADDGIVKMSSNEA